MQNRIHEYVLSLGCQYKTEGTQFNVQRCPQCSDNKWHFYIHKDTGCWDCKKCGGNGCLYDLIGKKVFDDNRKFLPQIQKTIIMPEQTQFDVWHELLFNNQKALSYLKNIRMFTEDTIKYFYLGYKNMDNKDWIVIPYCENGKLVNAKSRTIPPDVKDFRRIPDCKSTLFNQDCLALYSEIYLTESETDAMMLWQMGFKNVVASVLGASGNKEEWIAMLNKMKKIYVVYDIDKAGRDGAKKIIQKLGVNRCCDIVLDFIHPEAKDVCDWFIIEGHTAVDFIERIEHANTLNDRHVVTLKQGLRNLKKEILSPATEYANVTRWGRVNKLLKGFHPGDVLVLAAPAKTGKTTLALNMALFNVKKMPVLFYCMEMGTTDLVRKIIQAELMVGNEEITPQMIDITMEKLGHLNLFFRKGATGETSTTIFPILKEIIQKHGIKMLFFDHLHYLCRSRENASQDVSATVKGFQMLSTELQIPIVLLAQPRKTSPENVMGQNDLKDSICIATDAAIIMVMWRERIVSSKADIKGGDIKEESLSPTTLIRIEASRYGAGGETMLFFEGKYSLFTETDSGKVSKNSWQDEY